MNIPKEVIKHAEAIYWDSTDGTEEAAFGVIAEWARREALKEAAQSIHDWGSVMAGPEGAYFARIFESRLRALLEGVTDEQ